MRREVSITSLLCRSHIHHCVVLSRSMGKMDQGMGKMDQDMQKMDQWSFDKVSMSTAGRQFSNRNIRFLLNRSGLVIPTIVNSIIENPIPQSTKYYCNPISQSLTVNQTSNIIVIPSHSQPNITVILKPSGILDPGIPIIISSFPFINL